MYENVYGKTPPRFGENAVTLPLDVNRPCFSTIWATILIFEHYFHEFLCRSRTKAPGGFIKKSRAGEPANFLAAPALAPDFFFKQLWLWPDFFPKQLRLWLLVIYFERLRLRLRLRLLVLLGAKAPLQPTSSEGLYVYMSVCLSVCLSVCM